MGKLQPLTMKIFGAGVLIWAMLLPAHLITGLIRERQSRQNQVVNEINSMWGGSQKVVGPVLVVPMETRVEDPKTKQSRTQIDYVYQLPKTLQINGELIPEVRRKSIYEAILYSANLKLDGDFSAVTISASANQRVLWDKARLLVVLSDMRGLKESVTMSWNNQQQVLNLDAATEVASGNGLSVPVAISQQKNIPFSLALNLNGSGRISFLPLGEKTFVDLKSAWTSPSFMGDYLPTKRSIDNSGFNSQWEIPHFSRKYPQQWVGSSVQLDQSPVFGVELIKTVDHYQKTERTTKYAILFLCLTFLVFFASEIYSGRSFHILQYILVGFALSLFYLLLLSLSEIVSFGWAYLIAASVVVGLITTYTKGVFVRKILTFAIFSVTTVVYGFLFILLQLEDYALLSGTLGLTVVLALLMYGTRKMEVFDNVSNNELQTPACR